jgi:hypothetical protein
MLGSGNPSDCDQGTVHYRLYTIDYTLYTMLIHYTHPSDCDQGTMYSLYTIHYTILCTHYTPYTTPYSVLTTPYTTPYSVLTIHRPIATKGGRRGGMPISSGTIGSCTRRYRTVLYSTAYSY